MARHRSRPLRLAFSEKSNADWAARKVLKIQIAAKLAGAIHYSDFLINVNQ